MCLPTNARTRRQFPEFLLLLLVFSFAFRTIANADVHEVRRVLVFNDFDEIASPGICSFGSTDLYGSQRLALSSRVLQRESGSELVCR